MSRRRCGGCKKGAPCAGCEPTNVTPDMAGRHVATTGRYATAQAPGADQQFTRSFDRNYDVQAYTGYPVSTVPAGQWGRGVLYRQAMPALVLQSPGPMFDRTDPRTWPNRVG